MSGGMERYPFPEDEPAYDPGNGKCVQCGDPVSPDDVSICDACLTIINQLERDVADDEAQREMPDHNTTPAQIETSLGYSFQLCLSDDLPEASPGHGVVHYLRSAASGRVRYWRVVPDAGKELPTLGATELAMHCRVEGAPVAFIAIRLMNEPNGDPLKSPFGYAVKADGTWLDGVLNCVTDHINIS